MSQSLSNRDVPLRAWLSRTFSGAQGQRGAATSWSAAPLSIFRAAPIANWQQEAGLPKTAFASNGITALGLIPFHQKGGRAVLGVAQRLPSWPHVTTVGCSRPVRLLISATASAAAATEASTSLVGKLCRDWLGSNCSR